jgi:hypothetical protein
MDALLDPAPALEERLTGQPHDVEGVHYRDRVRELFGGGGLEAGKPVHRNDLDPVAPSLGSFGQVVNACLERPSTMSRSRAGPAPSRIPVRSMITVTYLVAAAGMSPHVLVDPDHVDAVEVMLVVDQDLLVLGQDRVVGGVPRNREAVGDPGHGQVLDHDRLQCPPQPAARELRSWLGGTAGVLAPHVPAGAAPVTVDRDQQPRGTPPNGS